MRLARRVIEGGPGAAGAAMTLLEHCDPPTLDAAVALLGDRDTLSQGAFDRLADAWDIYRHLKYQSWD